MNKWLLTLIFTFFVSGTANAHHGWRWTSDTNVEVTGSIESATLGNPHGILILDVNGEKWTVEVGQPWRNDRAGLTNEMLSEGNEIRVDGQRATDPGDLRVKAESIEIKGKLYVLYPDRL